MTLQRIADHLGVSRTTVSNAYNRPDQLTAELRDRILAEAERVGYLGPNPAGRMLRTGRRNALGLLFTEDLHFVFGDPVMSAFMEGVAETAAHSGTGLTLLPVPAGLPVAESAIPTAAVDGYIVFSVAAEHPALAPIVSSGVPVIVVDEPSRDDLAGFVGIDDRAGATLAAHHLLSLGHQRLGIVTSRLGLRARPGRVDRSEIARADVRVARVRLTAYLDAIAAADLDPDAVPIFEASGNDPDAGRVAATDLLTTAPEVTGLLCVTDQIAIGAVQAAAVSGRSVPDDLSVVGFDDIPRATTWDPPLTTIRQPLVDKGRIAARMLLDATAGQPPRRTILPIGLVERASTGPPRRG